MHKQNDELTRQRDECIRQMQNVEREKNMNLPWPKIQKITKNCPDKIVRKCPVWRKKRIKWNWHPLLEMF